MGLIVNSEQVICLSKFRTKANIELVRKMREIDPSAKFSLGERADQIVTNSECMALFRIGYFGEYRESDDGVFYPPVQPSNVVRPTAKIHCLIKFCEIAKLVDWIVDSNQELDFYRFDGHNQLDIYIIMFDASVAGGQILAQRMLHAGVIPPKYSVEPGVQYV